MLPQRQVPVIASAKSVVECCLGSPVNTGVGLMFDICADAKLLDVMKGFQRRVFLQDELIVYAARRMLERDDCTE